MQNSVIDTVGLQYKLTTGVYRDLWPRYRQRRCWWIVLVTLIAAESVQADPNFSQHQGFKEYFEAHPRVTVPANSNEQVLLQRFRPRLFVDTGAEGPLDFYADYIAQGELRAGDGRVINTMVDAALLNAHRDDASVMFVHQPQRRPVTPAAYGRVDYDTLPGLGRLSFLTWHFAFRVSGLSAGMPLWQQALLGLAGDLEDWHQLDNYTAATLVLNASEHPIALVLQQHNNQRSYVLGADLKWPDDNRVCLVAAQRSNELYPCAPGAGATPQRHRMVSFITEGGLRYLVLGQPKPRMSAEDIASADREVQYRLDFLSPSDAFYSFTGWLGERRLLPGRDGPPGADYKTLPPYMAPAIQLVAFNWREDDVEQMEMLTTLAREPSRSSNAFRQLVNRFIQRVQSRAMDMDRDEK